jgi:hypothetical protein
MEWEWLGRYVRIEERRTARAWADGLAATELRTAVYGDWRVGDWVAGSVHSHFRASQLDFTDPGIVAAYRSYVFSGLVACFGVERLLDEFAPDVLFIFNGRQSSLRIALELARARGIRVVSHERGHKREALALVEGGFGAYLAALRGLWDDWATIPLLGHELDAVAGYLDERAHGRNLGWKSYSPAPQRADEVRASLGLSPDRPLWALFTSSDDEMVAEADYQGPFARQLDWVERSVAWAERHPELDLVVRVHPNTAGRRATGSNLTALREFEALVSRLPANVRIVMPEDAVSSYTLMDLADVGLVYHSTVAVELACRGKRVVVGGANVVGGLPFVTTVERAAGYEALLDEVAPASTREAAKIRRDAFRFAYAYFFRLDVPFPLVRMPELHTGELAYSSLEALLPGRDAGLDRACAILLEGEPVVAPPSEAERVRADDDERAFFGEGRLAVLAFADELVAHPELLAAWGAVFTGADPATLVIQAPVELNERLLVAVGAAGLDGEEAADLVAVAAPPEHVDAVFSRTRAYDGAPRFDDTSVVDLRALALRAA